MHPHLAPILGRNDVIEFVRREREAGKKIILANGCFDILHAGHIRYLAGAKALEGVLVVGINSDHQVRRLKGDGRPALPEGERAEVIAALRVVDAVTVFDEPTVHELIEAIKPDFHAKGTDYTVDTVPERDAVRSYGGTVVIVGDPKDHSSSEIIHTISAREK